MQQNIRTNEMGFLNTIKETIAYNLQNICKITSCYTDIIYDKRFNDAVKEKLEKFQYSAALIFTGPIKGTSRERLYKELGLESLCDRRWYRKLVFFYKIVKGLAPSYLQLYLLPDNERTYNTRSSLRNMIKTFATRTSTFRAIFFLIAQKNGTN